MPLTLALRAFKDSITLRQALAGSIGAPEVSSGMPSPPLSPPLVANRANAAPASHTKRRRGGGAAYAISGECERLFCHTLRAIFLGERKSASTRGPLEIATYQNKTLGLSNGNHRYGIPSPPDEEDVLDNTDTEEHMVENDLAWNVSQWLEMWDYGGGARFRGFVTERDENERAMFIFFDEGVVGRDLKPGLMALLELCAHSSPLQSNELFVCLPRHTETETAALMRDLGWVGFEPATLDKWMQPGDVDDVSDRWLFLGLEV